MLASEEMNVRIRPFEDTDCEATMHLFLETVHEINRRDYTPDQLDAWAPAETDPNLWRKSFHGKIAFVAERDGEILGFGEVVPDGRIDRLYVHEDFQRSAIGKGLYSALETEAKRLGLTRLVTESSITTRPFFESVGFQVVREQEVERRDLCMRNYLMEKRLCNIDKGKRWI
jgi:ribosomal protein S18 acetylase RimI-like enzyme